MATPPFDFSPKQQIPLDALANAYQNKAKIEMDMKVQQAALDQQKINNMKTVFEGAAGMVSDLVEQSKQKQMKDALFAWMKVGDTKTYGQGKMSVAPGITEADSGLTVPDTAPAREIPSGMAPQGALRDTKAYKDELLSRYMQAYPKEGAETMSKILQNQIAPKDLSEKNRYQQSTMQYRDKSGKMRTVQVTFDTATGQQVDPRTLVPITAGTDLDSLPERGYAQTLRPAGFTADGREIVADARSGEKFVLTEAGYEPYDGRIFPKTENLPVSFVDAKGELEYTKDLLGGIKERFDPAVVGPIASRVANLKQYVEGLSDEEYTKFQGDLAELKNATIRAITGAQLNKDEVPRILAQLPDDRKSPTAFMAQWERVIQRLDQRIGTKEREFGRAGYVQRGQPVSEAELSGILDKKIPTKKTVTPKDQPKDIESALRQILPRK